MIKSIPIVILCGLLLYLGCTRESFITSPDARIRLSADTLKYDTVFVSSGSIVQTFKIVNENKEKLRLSSVRLAGGTASAYKINVDGTATTEARDLVLEAQDSLYVFVQVNINPATGNLPFIVRDSVEITYNGNRKWLQLEAWGQQAHFLRNHEVTTDETWQNDLPYVILGYLHVNPSVKLSIEKGCRIYVHADAPLVVDGTLQVNGQQDTADRVVFSGDRLDLPYRDYPASWPGIYFRSSSRDNLLSYAVVKNAYQALVVQDPASNAPAAKLVLQECVVDNAYDYGVLALQSSIDARNCLISNCGKNLALVRGGRYNFTHCTVASYSNNYVQHKDPVLILSNYDATGAQPLLAGFRNCIFWGEGGLVDTELLVLRSPSQGFSVTVDQVLWKLTTAPANITLVNPAPIYDQAPQFDSIDISRQYYDFRLKAGSPAVNKGKNQGVSIDLDGKPRPVGLPDLGCFERQ